MISQLTGKGRRILFVALVAAQVLFLCGLSVSYYAIGWLGKEIKLQTKPIDPRDLFYGDYVILSYEISQVNESQWRGGEKPERNDVVYVLLQPEKQTGVYEVKGVYPGEPTAAGEEVVLKGTLSYYNEFDRQLNIKYGLERFYVQENTGLELEKRAGNTIVRVQVAPWGQAKVLRVE